MPKGQLSPNINESLGASTTTSMFLNVNLKLFQTNPTSFEASNYFAYLDISDLTDVLIFIFIMYPPKRPELIRRNLTANETNSSCARFKALDAANE